MQKAAYMHEPPKERKKEKVCTSIIADLGAAQYTLSHAIKEETEQNLFASSKNSKKMQSNMEQQQEEKMNGKTKQDTWKKTFR